MKTLEQEAKEYAIELLSKMVDRKTAVILESYAQTDFIAGANSKYVQAEKIKTQIEIYQSLLDQCENHKAAICKYMIEEKMILEQQLKELEDETKI
jgi:hypothetical protein